MSRKNVLVPYKLFEDQSLNASFTSPVTNIQYLDNVAIQLNWSSTTAEGFFSIEVSLDNLNWVPLALSAAPTVLQDSDVIFLDLNQLATSYIRVSYTKTAVGATDGVASCLIAAKMI
jgi:hypothetical protein